ncbi:MAG: GSCFA domain-containing protein [Bacteroidales bacterium]|nr:GSCFA domain-containing protein [Bacteroidales bacterium]
MRFRTEIESIRPGFNLGFDRPVLLLGSCFTDEIGARLENDGFDVMRNPFGALYNPASIANCISRAAADAPYTVGDLNEGPRGMHCLDYATRFSGADADILLADINAVRSSLADFLGRKPVVIITLGSAFVFRLAGTNRIVGNCHKFDASCFERERLTVDEIENILLKIVDTLRAAGVENIIFTVSPIRHLADGLHGNELSKASLLLAVDAAVERVGEGVFYFPSYEIMLDDLRDYRFYAQDMKHPSDTAVDYIYEKFAEAFFTKETLKKALDNRRASRSANHRQIL